MRGGWGVGVTFSGSTVQRSLYEEDSSWACVVSQGNRTEAVIQFTRMLKKGFGKLIITGCLLYIYIKYDVHFLMQHCVPFFLN